MYSKRKLLQTPLAIAEDIKLQLMATVDHFMTSDDDSYTFPASLTKTERMFLHGYTVQKGVHSQSTGVGDNRRLTIYHTQSNASGGGQSQPPPPKLSKLSLSTQSRKSLYRCFSNLPRSSNKDKEQSKATRPIDRRQFGMSTLTNGVACVPPPAGRIDTTLDNTRKSLPIYESRQHIIDTINHNQVVILVGETGSGKTTQVPQYLLEDATATGTNCRIVCTQPRRLSALSVADRVAFERSEETGGTVGFQIRLESRTCPRSNLIYCTNGILVRCLMTGEHERTFNNITHIILDEIHERDKNADFLLITIRDVLRLNPRLKLILMSATIDTSLFAKYFDQCPEIYVPGRTFDVQQLYLEDVLRLTQFKRAEVEMAFEKSNRNRPPPPPKQQSEVVVTKKGNNRRRHLPSIEVDAETQQFVNKLLERCLKEDLPENFDQFVFMVEAEEVDVDFQHGETQLTGLMIAATRGCADVVETLLSLGADVNLKTSSNGYTALDLAEQMGNEECAKHLRCFLSSSDSPDHETSSPSSTPPTTTSTDPTDSSEYVDILLDVYNTSFNATIAVDRFLILDLIEFIHHKMPMGSVLIFLPGYEDITSISGLIQDRMTERRLKANLRLYTLHSNMKVNDQKAVFKPAPFGCRKIILSTNIAETSITIDDVVYVIDCGKVKQTNFDVHTGTNCLETVPISKACSKQRAGRAGRVTSGICYKLYSRKQYEWMGEFTVPELMRVPLTDICLAAKLIAPQEQIEEFLGKAVTPPLRKCIQRSVELLKKIGALQEEGEEVITNLGTVLADLPVDAHLGKMIIYAIVLKCVDPVLTVVSALSVKSIFTLPPDKKSREEAREWRQGLSEDALSDHLVMIRVFQKWLEYSSRRSADEFCQRHWLNGGSLQTICGMRSLILGHLRANRLIKSNGKGNIHDLNANARNWAVVKACLVAGLYPNVCERVLKRGRYFLRGEMKESIHLHSQSVLKVSRNTELNNLPTDWIVFEEKVRSAGKAAAIDCNTTVTASTIALFAGNLSLGEECIHVADGDEEEDDDEDENWDEDDVDKAQRKHRTDVQKPPTNTTTTVHMRVNKWITLQLEEESAAGLLELRRLFNELLMRMLNGHESFHAKLDMHDNLIIATIADVLAAEDKVVGLVQPKGVGDRPQAVHLDINFGIHEPSGSRASSSAAEAAVDCEVVTTTAMGMGRMSLGGGGGGGHRGRNQWNSNNNSGRGGGANGFSQRNQSQQSFGERGDNRAGQGRTGRGRYQGNANNNKQAATVARTRYFVVRLESRNEVQKVLQGLSFYPLEFLKRELGPSANQTTFVVVFSVPESREFFGCAVVDPRKRQGHKLVVDRVSEKSLWHYCYRSWNTAMDQEAVNELNVSDGEYLYNYFSEN